MKSLLRALAIAAGVAHSSGAAAARDHIWVVGSSTVQPFTKAVAERVAKAVGAPAPLVENTGTTPGFLAICAGLGADYPDATNSTRRMKKSEFDRCQKNGVAEIVEIPVGLDILVMAQSRAGPAMKLTLTQMFLALANEVPDGDGGLTANPYRRWSEIDGTLPKVKIDVRVLPPISGTRDALQELFLKRGAESLSVFGELMKTDKTLQAAAKTIRSDVFVMVREDQNKIVRDLLAKPNGFGFFGYRFLQANTRRLRAVTIDGVEPTEEHAYDGTYKGTRTLYLYVRKAQLETIRGLSKLPAEYLSSAALGPDGYLLRLGYVPLGMAEMLKTLALVNAMTPLKRDGLPD
jgi:phosphate transport system substrate-binding protein